MNQTTIDNMESKHTIEKTKELSLNISSSFEYKLYEHDIKFSNVLPYNIYNINCFYDYNEPSEFLWLLLNHATQKSLDVGMNKVGKDRYAITYAGDAVAYFCVARKHIDMESGVTFDVLELRYGNKLNTFNILQYILRVLSMSQHLKHIKQYKHPTFSIFRLDKTIKKWIPGFKNFRKPNNIYEITVHDHVVDMNFAAEYCYETKTIKFKYFLENEGEIYHNGSEPLTIEQIEQQVEFYESLKKQIDPIEIYLEQLQKTL